MRKILAILLFFTFAFASELKIATYNVENLFDAKVQGSESVSYTHLTLPTKA